MLKAVIRWQILCPFIHICSQRCSLQKPLQMLFILLIASSTAVRAEAPQGLRYDPSARSAATVLTPELVQRGSSRPLVMVGKAVVPPYVIPVAQRRLFDKVERAVANGQPAKLPTPALAKRAAGRVDIVSAPALYVLPANLRPDRARKGKAVPTTTAAMVPTPAQLAPGLNSTRRTP